MECCALVTARMDGVIVAVDEQACRLFGYSTPAQLVGCNVNVLCPSPYREQHDSYLARYAATGVARIIGKGRKVEAQHRDGHVVPVQLHVSVVRDATGQVRRRVRASGGGQALTRLCQLLYLGSLGPAPSPQMRLSVSKEGTILSVASSELFGWSSTRLLGLNVSLLVPDPWRAQHPAMMQMFIRTGVSNVVGRVRNVPMQRGDGTLTQVTLRVVADVVNGSPVYHATVDPVDASSVLTLTVTSEGVIQSAPVSDALVTPLLGYAHDELLDRTLQSVVPQLRAEFTDGEKLVEGFHKDGSRVPLAVALWPIHHDAQVRGRLEGGVQEGRR